MADISVGTRRMGIITIFVAVVSMACTQLGFFAVAGAHVLAALAPITAAAFLYGPAIGAAVGAVGGLAQMLHAQLFPLDYYEKYFAFPFNSLVLFALFGLVMGLLFATTDSRFRRSDWRRILALGVSCLLGCMMVSALLGGALRITNEILAFKIPFDTIFGILSTPEVLLQILLDTLLMFVLAVAADKVNDRRLADVREHSLRETFQNWLFVVIALAYMVVGAIAYTGVTMQGMSECFEEMGDEIDYLSEQLNQRDTELERLLGLVNDEKDAYAMHEESVRKLAVGRLFWGAGTIVVADNDKIVSSNDESLVGMSFSEVVNAGLTDMFVGDIFEANRLAEYYTGEGSEMSYARAAQMAYSRVASRGEYQFMIVLGAEDVFYNRPFVMTIVSGVFVLLLVAVYLLALKLLDAVVVRGINETNESLAKITAGDLDESVDVHDSAEFTSLSRGINTTVGALKDSIAEAASRYDRELMTAKAIQESALPRTFPPFPQIEAFDIYASMNPAKEVGGDFYDFFLIDDNTLGFLIADVSGKGIPASLFMMTAKTHIMNYMSSGMDLAQAIATANQRLCEGNDADMFVTVWAATLDWTSGLVTYVNAGHNPPVLRHDGTWEYLRKNCGLFLGAFEEARFRTESFVMGPHDELLLYTDGVTEAMDLDEKLYGEERLVTLLSKHPTNSPKSLVEVVRRDLAAYSNGAEQADDITMVSLEFGVAPEVSAQIMLPVSYDSIDRALEFVNRELAQRLCPIEARNRIDFALQELFGGVCHRGLQKGGPTQCRVGYVYSPTDSSLTVRLSDNGPAFDPISQETSGIHSVMQGVDSIAYEHDGSHNITTFVKRW